MRISDWSSDVCSSYLSGYRRAHDRHHALRSLADRHPACRQCSHRAPQLAVGEEAWRAVPAADRRHRSEEHTSELQSLMRISYAVFCLKKQPTTTNNTNT